MLIETTDLSPIRGIGAAEDAWLRQLAQRASASSLTLRLSSVTDDDEEAILTFDARTAMWWTGRYVGELRFHDGVLRILPRFGVSQLQRWLSRVWGVRILSSKGRYESSRLWLWELLAKLWEGRLLAAAKHGLPTRRTDEEHVGATVRGRLDVKQSARELHRRSGRLVSRTRNRAVDSDIATILLCAYVNLRRHLVHLGDPRAWLTPRAQNLILSIQNAIGARVSPSTIDFDKTIRYTPINESYRPLVALSLSILRQRPMSSTTEGSNDVLGVMIDMAEIWELYVCSLLRAALLEADVLHAARNINADSYLLQSSKTGEMLARLKPDVMIRAFASGKLLSVLDAKYKTTHPAPDRPSGVLREDLYQQNAYLSAFADRSAPVLGGLIYPSESGAAIARLQAANAWRTAGTAMPFYFFGIDSDSNAASLDSFTDGEKRFLESVRLLLPPVD